MDWSGRFWSHVSRIETKEDSRQVSHRVATGSASSECDSQPVSMQSSNVVQAVRKWVRMNFSCQLSKQRSVDIYVVSRRSRSIPRQKSYFLSLLPSILHSLSSILVNVTVEVDWEAIPSFRLLVHPNRHTDTRSFEDTISFIIDGDLSLLPT